MGYIQGFKHDLFISYASADNEVPGSEEGKGWVTATKERLSRYLRMKLGLASIWFDNEKIITGDDFETEIQEALKNSATILIFLSDAYLRSPWCNMELTTFLDCLAEYRETRTAGMPGSGRIFNARLSNEFDKPIPEVLQKLHHTDFFNKDSKAGVPLCWPMPSEHSKSENHTKWNDTINELGNDIIKQLKRLKKGQKNKAANYYRGNSSTGNNRVFYEERLRECDGLIIIYGEADENWVTLHLQNSYTAYHTLRNKRPYAGGAIIIPPPKIEREMISYEPLYMKRIDCTRGFDPEKMEDFCKSVKSEYKKDKEIHPDRYPAPLVFVHALGESDRKFAENIRKMGRDMEIECIIPKE